MAIDAPVAEKKIELPKRAYEALDGWFRQNCKIGVWGPAPSSDEVGPEFIELVETGIVEIKDRALFDRGGINRRRSKHRVRLMTPSEQVAQKTPGRVAGSTNGSPAAPRQPRPKHIRHLDAFPMKAIPLTEFPLDPKKVAAYYKATSYEGNTAWHKAQREADLGAEVAKEVAKIPAADKNDPDRFKVAKHAALTRVQERLLGTFEGAIRSEFGSTYMTVLGFTDDVKDTDPK